MLLTCDTCSWNRKQIDKSQKQQQKRTAKQIEEIKRMVKWRACKCE